ARILTGYFQSPTPNPQALRASRRYSTLAVNDCSDECTARPQRALSLRLGPQIQTLLSREGRSRGSRGAGQGRRRSAALRDGRRRTDTHTKASDGPALEGDLDSCFHPAPGATQGGRQLISPDSR